MTPRSKFVLTLSAILAASACGDRALTGPNDAAVGSRATLAAAGTPGSSTVSAVRLLKRAKALKSTISVDAVIGPAGGTLSIPQAGVQVTFPRGAVSRPTRITLTATRGPDVVYEFQPHGLKFGVPVIVSQDLKKTTAGSDQLLAASLQGSYFEGSLAANRIGTRGVYARIAESRKARLNGASQTLEFSIEHFSGYTLSTGLVAVDVSVDVDAR